MANIHVGQTAIRLEFIIDVDITGYEKVEIRYEKPNQIRGAFPAQVEEVETGKVYYDVESTGDLDDTGQWNFWVHVEFLDGTELDSNTITTSIFEPGTPYLANPYGKISLDGGIIMPIEAFRVIYNNATSNLQADDVQGAIDELKNLVSSLEASSIGYNSDDSELNVGNVKAAIDKIANDRHIPDNNFIYVSKIDGSDTPSPTETADELGTIYHPYGTIQAAIDRIDQNGDNDQNAYVVVIYPGLYEETVSLNYSSLRDISLVGYRGVEISPTSGNALESVANNQDFTIFEAHNIRFNGDVHFEGEADGGDTLSSIGSFFDCLFLGEFRGVNVGTFNMYSSKTFGDIYIKNITGGVVSGGDGQGPGDITLLWNSADPKPAGATSTFFAFEKTLSLACNFTIDDNTELQLREGSRLGSPGCSMNVTNGGNIDCYGGQLLFDTITIGSGSTLNTRFTYYDPAGLTVDGTHNNMNYSGAMYYDNSSSGLSANTVQDAIDELKNTYHP